MNSNKILFRTAVLSLLVVLGCFSSPLFAQKVPIALKKDALYSPTNAAEYKRVAEAYKKSGSMQDRNKLIYMAIAQIDLNFGNFQEKKRKRNELFQTLVDILEIAASTAISITKGERPKTIIAEALGFVQASRTSVNKNLRLLELQILFNKMVAKRGEILQGIATKAALPDSSYPFEVAVVDIIAYYEAGTIDGALTNLATDTGREASNATRALPTLRIATKKQVDEAIDIDNFISGLIKKAEKGDADAIAKIKSGLRKYAEAGLDSGNVLPTDPEKINDLDKLPLDAAIQLLGDLRIEIALQTSGDNEQKLLGFLK
jgi:hypothetical protein